MRRILLFSLVGSVALAQALLGGDTDGSTHARTTADNPSLDLVAPAQPVPPFTPPDPAAPVRGGTPGTDLADVPLEPLSWIESIIGDDGRVCLVGGTTEAPWRWVSYLTVWG